MTSKITIFDHSLSSLTELSGIPTTPRSYVLNGIGRAEFSIGYFKDRADQSVAYAPEKVTAENFQFGNLVHIEHIPSRDAAGNVNGKLPDWVGIIEPLQTWDFGVLHAEALSAENILADCPMPLERIEGTPKAMFKKILGYANDFIKRYGGGVVLHPGIVEDVSVTLTDDLTLSAHEHIKALCRRAGMDWDVTGEIDPHGRLQLYANLYERRGVETDLTLTNTNSELGSPLLTLQGAISNVVIGYSQASSKAGRHMGVGINEQALADYGPHGVNTTFSGLRDAGSVRSAAQARADARGRPVMMVGRTVTDERDNLSKIGVGNIVNIVERNAGFAPGGGFGFEAQARILSVTYNDLSNRAPLNLEVI
jgi:hypothetical protein